nr:hypothetical protein [Nocardia beijingensis]
MRRAARLFLPRRRSRSALRARRSRVEHQLDRRWPDQNAADDLIVEHATMRIQAEIDWHEKVLADIDKLDTSRS